MSEIVFNFSDWELMTILASLFTKKKYLLKDTKIIIDKVSFSVDEANQKLAEIAEKNRKVIIEKMEDYKKRNKVADKCELKDKGTTKCDLVTALHFSFDELKNSLTNSEYKDMDISKLHTLLFFLYSATHEAPDPTIVCSPFLSPQFTCNIIKDMLLQKIKKLVQESVYNDQHKRAVLGFWIFILYDIGKLKLDKDFNSYKTEIDKVSLYDHTSKLYESENQIIKDFKKELKIKM